MKALLLLSVLISLSSPALARIGETREQCDARYGKPVEVKDPNGVKYQKSGLNVICRFIEGKCGYIYFSKIQKDAQNESLPLPVEEAKILMEVNSGGAPWSKAGEIAEDGFEAWESGDLEAGYSKIAPSFLSIDTLAYRKYEEARKAADKKGDLKDF
jgi:hypothetical protein